MTVRDFSSIGRNKRQVEKDYKNLSENIHRQAKIPSPEITRMKSGLGPLLDKD